MSVVFRKVLHNTSVGCVVLNADTKKLLIIRTHWRVVGNLSVCNEGKQAQYKRVIDNKY